MTFSNIFLCFPGIKHWHFMQIIFLGDNLHDMSISLISTCLSYKKFSGSNLIHLYYEYRLLMLSMLDKKFSSQHLVKCFSCFCQNGTQFARNIWEIGFDISWEK